MATVGIRGEIRLQWGLPDPQVQWERVEHSMKRLKSDLVYYALWLTAITSMVLASGAPDKWRP